MTAKITFNSVTCEVLGEAAKLCGYSGKFSIVPSPENFMADLEALNALEGPTNIEVIYE